MSRDFNIRFNNAEIIGGTDNLLENTKVTKVMLRGDNKLSSLNSTFKNCSDLDIIEGEIDLDGIAVIDEILNNTKFVKHLNLVNVNNPNITANMSFPYLDSIEIGGRTYDKTAIQNVLGGCTWKIGDIAYYETVAQQVTDSVIEINNDIKITIVNSLECSIREFEIHGETYQNLINGKEEKITTEEYHKSITETDNKFISDYPFNVIVDEIQGNTIQDDNDLENIKNVGFYNASTDSYNVEIFNSDTVETVENNEGNINIDTNGIAVIKEIKGNTLQNLSGLKGEQIISTELEIVDGYGEINTVSGKTSISEIYGNTYQNLIHGKEEKELTDILEVSLNHETNMFKDSKERHIKVNKIEGDTFENLINGNKIIQLNEDKIEHVLNSKDMMFSDIKNYEILEFEGNTYQDKSNLNTIESVGIPYLDENNVEKYSVEIFNDNITYEVEYDINCVTKISNNRYKLKNPNGWNKVNIYLTHANKIPLNTNITFNIKYYNNTILRGVGLLANHDDLYSYRHGGFDKNNNDLQTLTVSTTKLTSLEKVKLLRFENSGEINLGECEFEFEILINNIPLETYKSQSQLISLPSQLHSLGSYFDKFYWDYSKEKYCMIKNIKKENLWELSIKQIYEKSNSDTIGVSFNSGGYEGTLFKPKNILLSNAFEYTGISPVSAGTLVNTTTQTMYISDYLFMSIKKTNLENYRDDLTDVEKKNLIMKYLTDNKVFAYGIAINSQIIELDDLRYPLKTFSPLSINSYSLGAFLSIGNREHLNGANNIKLSTHIEGFYVKSLVPNTLYTVQFNSYQLGSDCTIKLNLGGKISTVDISTQNTVKITTDTVVSNSLLEISGKDIIIYDIMVFKGDKTYKPKYYVEGEQSVGEYKNDCFEGESIAISNLYYNYKLEEIKGKTIQKELDKTIIQSVGELYVDNSGTPILDSNGNNQYKINLICSNGVDDTAIDYKSNTKQILLPQQLKWIGSTVCDRLYWDGNKQKYIIEQQVGIIDKSLILSNINRIIADENRTFIYDIWNTVDSQGVNNRITTTFQKINGLFKCSDYGNTILYLNWDEQKLLENGFTETMDMIRLAIESNFLYCYFQYKEPKIIETNIAEQISFDSSSYYQPLSYFSLEGLSSNIKISNEYYSLKLTTSQYDMEGNDIIW